MNVNLVITSNSYWFMDCAVRKVIRDNDTVQDNLEVCNLQYDLLDFQDTFVQDSESATLNLYPQNICTSFISQPRVRNEKEK